MRPDSSDLDGVVEAGAAPCGRYWTGELTWSHISDDLLMVKETARTGADVGHDLKLTPLVIQLPCQIPADSRFGPVIGNEAAQMRAAHRNRR